MPAGGRGGIRTHGGVAPTAVFKTAALNHSATLPGGIRDLTVTAAAEAASTAEQPVDLPKHSAYLTAHARSRSMRCGLYPAISDTG